MHRLRELLKSGEQGGHRMNANPPLSLSMLSTVRAADDTLASPESLVKPNLQEMFDQSDSQPVLASQQPIPP